jgi:hypothetical protein
VPDLVAHGRALGLLARAERVVDDPEVGAEPGDAGADPGGAVLAARGGLPQLAALAGEAVAERRAVLAHQGLDAAGEPLGHQGRGVRRAEHGEAGGLGEEPRREQHRGVGGLRRARRHGDQQAVGPAARHRLQLGDQQPVVRRRRLAQRGEGVGGRCAARTAASPPAR